MIRMLIVGYCFGIRSERRLCDEVHRNLAYRWFCRLGLDGRVPDHSTFSKNRHGRFRESDLFRRVFETVLRRCIRERLVGGEAFAVDASLIKADANRQKGIEGEKGLPPEATSRAIEDYLAVLDDAAFGAATEVTAARCCARPQRSSTTARRCSTLRFNAKALDVRSSPGAVRTHRRGRSRDRSMKVRATWPGRSPGHGKGARLDGCARKSRCCLPISNAF
jgi:hypothetical protein